jgi:hypothetical protein
LQVLAAFGLRAENCVMSADFNDDCRVNVSDLLLILSVFGGGNSGACAMSHIDDQAPKTSHRWCGLIFYHDSGRVGFMKIVYSYVQVSLLLFDKSGMRRLQTNAEGRTIAEASAGSPAICHFMIMGAVYFDTDDGHFYGCSSPSPSERLSNFVWGPLGGGTPTDGHFVCKDGWGGAACTEDARTPTLTCASGVVSVLASGDSRYTITAADVPRPTVVDTGPEYGAMTVTLGLAAQHAEGNVGGGQSWQMNTMPTATVFDFDAAVQTSVTISANVTVNSAEGDPEADAITAFVYTAVDHAGNSGTCEIMVHVVDFNECAGEGGGHTCVENAVCENLLDTRDDDLASGTYQCRCRPGFKGDGYTSCESEGACAVAYTHYRLVTTGTIGGSYTCIDSLRLGFTDSGIDNWPDGTTVVSNEARMSVGWNNHAEDVLTTHIDEQSTYDYTYCQPNWNGFCMEHGKIATPATPIILQFNLPSPLQQHPNQYEMGFDRDEFRLTDWTIEVQLHLDACSMMPSWSSHSVSRQ